MERSGNFYKAIRLGYILIREFNKQVQNYEMFL